MIHMKINTVKKVKRTKLTLLLSIYNLHVIMVNHKLEQEYIYICIYIVDIYIYRERERERERERGREMIRNWSVLFPGLICVK